MIFHAYVGYSTIAFGAATQDNDGGRYFSLEENPEFAAISSSLCDLAGVRDTVKVVVGSSDESLRRLHAQGVLKHIDLLFLDHLEPLYTRDLQICESLGLTTEGTVIVDIRLTRIEQNVTRLQPEINSDFHGMKNDLTGIKTEIINLGTSALAALDVGFANS